MDNDTAHLQDGDDPSRVRQRRSASRAVLRNVTNTALNQQPTQSSANYTGAEKPAKRARSNAKAIDVNDAIAENIDPNEGAVAPASTTTQSNITSTHVNDASTSLRTSKKRSASQALPDHNVPHALDTTRAAQEIQAANATMSTSSSGISSRADVGFLPLPPNASASLTIADKWLTAAVDNLLLAATSARQALEAELNAVTTSSTSSSSTSASSTSPSASHASYQEKLNALTSFITTLASRPTNNTIIAAGARRISLGSDNASSASSSSTSDALVKAAVVAPDASAFAASSADGSQGKRLVGASESFAMHNGLPVPALPATDSTAMAPHVTATVACPPVLPSFHMLQHREGDHAIVAYLAHQPQVTPHMRAVLVDWMREVSAEHRLHDETYFLSVRLVDRLLSAVPVPRKELQLVGAACVLLSAKLEEIHSLPIQNFEFLCDKLYTRQQFVTMESVILRKLDYQMHSPHIYTMLGEVLSHINASDRVRYICQYIAYLVVIDYHVALPQPSIVAVAITALALKSEGLSPLPALNLVPQSRWNEVENAAKDVCTAWSKIHDRWSNAANGTSNSTGTDQSGSSTNTQDLPLCKSAYDRFGQPDKLSVSRTMNRIEPGLVEANMTNNTITTSTATNNNEGGNSTGTSSSTSTTAPSTSSTSTSSSVPTTASGPSNSSSSDTVPMDDKVKKEYQANPSA